MEDVPLQKISISGPTLASLLHRFSFSISAVHGLLFGHLTRCLPSLSDDSPTPSSADEPLLVATVTGFLSSTFHDAAGQIDPAVLDRLSAGETLIGWFSGRRRTGLRPSLREASVSASLASAGHGGVFLLLASPARESHAAAAIHTLEYRAFQFRAASSALEARTVEVVNIGPAFRGHYSAFTPNAPFPSMESDFRRAPAEEDGEEGRRSLATMKAEKKLEMVAEGLSVSELKKLVGNEAVNYTARLEELYEKMLLKMESLTRLVEKSDARVVEQETQNRKLRCKISRSGGLE